MPDNGKTVAQLGDEIFALVQGPQGKGFVSDGINALKTTDQLFAVIRGHRKQTALAARIMAKWLDRYGER